MAFKFFYLGKRTVLITETWQLPLGRKIIAVYSEDCRNRWSALYGYSTEFLNAEADGTYSFNELKACISCPLIVNNAYIATFWEHKAYFIYSQATVHLPQYHHTAAVTVTCPHWLYKLNGKNKLPTSSLRSNLNIFTQFRRAAWSSLRGISFLWVKLELWSMNSK